MMAAENKFGDEGIVALAPALGKLVALTSLNLSGTWLGMQRMGGVLSICGAGLCGRRWSTVVTLWRWWSCRWMAAAENKLGADGMVALAPALAKLVALTSLELSCTWL